MSKELLELNLSSFEAKNNVSSWTANDIEILSSSIQFLWVFVEKFSAVIASRVSQVS